MAPCVVDIEEVDGKACVACPHHGFSFDLQTGICIAPRGNLKQEVWPVRIKDDGMLSIGFKGISNSIFAAEDFYSQVSCKVVLPPFLYIITRVMMYIYVIDEIKHPSCIFFPEPPVV